MQEVFRKCLQYVRLSLATALIVVITLPALGLGWRDPEARDFEQFIRRVADWTIVALDTLQIPTGGAGG